MSRLKTKSLHAAIAAVAAIAVMSIGASAASAAPAAFNIPAKSSVNAKLSGTLTVSEFVGGPKVTCTLTNAFALAQNTGAPSQGQLVMSAESVKTTCSNGNQLSIGALLNGIKTGSAFTVKATAGFLGKNPFFPVGSPGHYWTSGAYEVPWANGAGATASKITFANTPVSANGLLLFTGSLSVSKADGSLLLLS